MSGINSWYNNIIQNVWTTTNTSGSLGNLWTTNNTTWVGNNTVWPASSGVIFWDIPQKKVVFDKKLAFLVIENKKELIVQSIDLQNVDAFLRYIGGTKIEVEDAELYVKSLKLENL